MEGEWWDVGPIGQHRRLSLLTSPTPPPNLCIILIYEIICDIMLSLLTDRVQQGQIRQIYCTIVPPSE